MQKKYSSPLKEIFVGLTFIFVAGLLMAADVGAWSGNPANSTNPGGWGGDNLTSNQISSWASNSSWTGSTALYSGSGGSGGSSPRQGSSCKVGWHDGFVVRSLCCYDTRGGEHTISRRICQRLSPPPPPPPPPRPTVNLEVRNITTDTDWTGSNIVIQPTDEVALKWSSTNSSSCSGSNFSTGGSTNSNTDSVVEPEAGTYVPYSVICYGNGYQAYDSVRVDTRAGTGADIEVENDDTIVHSGDEVTLTWDVGTSDPSTCEIRLGNNTVTGYATLSSATGSFTYTITAESTFTLDCESGVNTDTQTITVLPEFQET